MYGLIIIYWLEFDLTINCDDGEGMICDKFVYSLINSFLKGLTAGGGISDFLSGGTYILKEYQIFIINQR